MDKNERNHLAFTTALEKFFNHNPRNPFWALMALYLRKKHELAIVENYHGTGRDAFASAGDENFVENRLWSSQPGSNTETRSLSILGPIAHNPRLQKIAAVFEKESNKADSLLMSASRSTYALEKTQWDPKFLLEFAEALQGLEDDWLERNFNNLFDAITTRLFNRIRGDIYTQPKEITKLVGALMGKDVRKIYDPFAGVASYALITAPGAEYIGEEKEELIAAIGNLRIMANGVKGEVIHENSINNKDYGADIIISTPPGCLKLKLEEEPWGKEYGRRNEAESFLIRKCLLKSKRGILTVLPHIATSVIYKDLRRDLVESGNLEAVIRLPARIFEMTSIAAMVFVMNPKNDHPGSVRFINASECYTRSGRRNTLNVQEIIALTKEENQFSRLIETEEIRQHDYFLNPAIYLRKKIELPEGVELIPLKDLGEIKRPEKARRVEKEGKLVTFNPQNNPNPIKIFKPSDFERSPLEGKHFCTLSGSGILISDLIMRKMRVLCYDFGEEDLFCRPSAYIFIPDESKILTRYLALQLNEPYVDEQVAGSNGLLNLSNWKNLEIIVPPLEEQRKAIEEFESRLLANLGLELSAVRGKNAEDLDREIRLRRHTLLNAIHGAVTGMALLDSFIDRQEGPFEKTAIVSKKKQLSLVDMVHRVNSNLERVVRLITDLGNLGDYDSAEKINISEFCNEYEARCMEEENFTVAWPNNNDVKEGLVEAESLDISFSRKELYTVFDNIITNARKHGFMESAVKDGENIAGNRNHLIRIEFEPSIAENGNEEVVIRILNNGLPLPQGIDNETLFEWGKGRDTGLGGWHIRQIVERFGGKVNAFNLENDERGFTVMYEIVLPHNN